MDAFEEIIGKLLEEEQYWIRHSVKIDLTKDEKKKIGKPTTPRPEIDIVVYDIPKNTIYLLEVKSYLDSKGVALKKLRINTKVQKGKYKLLTSSNYRTILTNRLKEDWVRVGAIKGTTVVSYGLIAGKVYQGKEQEVRQLFEGKGWLFWGPTEIREKIEKLAQKGYENDPVTIVCKLLMRK
ncbi:MAG: hypothetical protein AABY52_02980 [Deltaproteobacteria bacterium]